MTTENGVPRDLPPVASTPGRFNSTTLSATAAVVLPFTAAVHGYFEKQRDIEVQSVRQQHEITLQREKYVHEARTAYLAQMREPAHQARVLRLVIATTADAAVRAWAEDELHRLEAQVAARQGHQRALDAAEQHAWEEALTAASADPRQRASLRAEIARRRSDLAEQERRVLSAMLDPDDVPRE